MSLSHTQVDRLGERLRRGGPVTREDLELLDAYRRSFTGAYDHVYDAVTTAAGLVPTGRPAKSTNAIIDKLGRETIRLSQVQDIAGCRVVVTDLDMQDVAATRLTEVLPECDVVDRRATPSHGYRAIHVVARIGGVPVEVQVRTEWQHRWAEVSEKLADLVDPGIKYGKGGILSEMLLRMSANIGALEAAQHSQQMARLGLEEAKASVVALERRLAGRLEAEGPSPLAAARAVVDSTLDRIARDQAKTAEVGVQLEQLLVELLDPELISDASRQLERMKEVDGHALPD